jgi:hypothetical protein
MTPNQFCIWLHGYASAKPEVLDPKVRDELDTIIANMVASKLSGGIDDAYERDLHMKRQYDIEMQKMQLEAQRQLQIAKMAPPAPIWISKTGLESGGIKYVANADKVETQCLSVGSTQSSSTDQTVQKRV